ncbi:MAG: hypothetical protein P4L85_02155 [Paludisphaera borealis]|uniref:hypothetical protein n=1 Tax=Paludisphaera borealis TaxID=1387353 RepID=UPI002846F7F7|nr:hypothetical protein [Paludisphaera borealis]MDR3618125.1 hypothetical protein [Paludisphaera borealis]
MRLEILFQFIVPLTFLAIWALTSLLNRETQPLPPRPVRPGARPGPGQGPGGGRGIGAAGERGQAEGTLQGAASRDPAFRTPGAPPESEPRLAVNLNDANVYVMDDEVVFVDPVTNRRIMSAPIRNAAAAAAAAAAVAARGGPKPQRGTQSRKAGRGRRTAAPARPTQAEPETRRALSDQVGRSMSLSRSRPLDTAPLTSNLTPLSASMTSSSAPARDLGLERSSAGPLLQARDIKEMLGTPTKLRETIVLAEILQPPVSARRRLRSR